MLTVSIEPEKPYLNASAASNSHTDVTEHDWARYDLKAYMNQM